MSDPITPSDFAVKHKDKEPEEIKRLWLAQDPKPERALQDRTITKAKTGKSVPRTSKAKDPWVAIEDALEALGNLVAAAKQGSGLESLSTKQVRDFYEARIVKDAESSTEV